MTEPSPNSKTDEVASKVVTARLTPTEYEQVSQKKGSQSWSSFLRQAALDQEPSPPVTPSPVPEINRQTYWELGQIGKNLNQQTKATHLALKQGHPLPIEPETLEALKAKIDQVRLELLGVSPGDSNGTSATTDSE